HRLEAVPQCQVAKRWNRARISVGSERTQLTDQLGEREVPLLGAHALLVIREVREARNRLVERVQKPEPSHLDGLKLHSRRRTLTSRRGKITLTCDHGFEHAPEPRRDERRSREREDWRHEGIA